MECLSWNLSLGSHTSKLDESRSASQVQSCAGFLPNCMMYIIVCPGQSDYLAACMSGGKDVQGGSGGQSFGLCKLLAGLLDRLNMFRFVCFQHSASAGRLSSKLVVGVTAAPRTIN